MSSETMSGDPKRITPALREPIDCLLDPLFEVDRRCEAEDVRRLGDVWSAGDNIGSGRLELDLRCRSSVPKDPPRQPERRLDLPRVSDVEGLPDSIPVDGGKQCSIHHVIDEAPSPQLSAGPIDEQGLVGQGTSHEVGNRPVSHLPGSVDVEGTENRDWQRSLPIVRHGEMLFRQFAHGVAPASFSGSRNHCVGGFCCVHDRSEDLARGETNHTFDCRQRGRGLKDRCRAQYVHLECSQWSVDYRAESGERRTMKHDVVSFDRVLQGIPVEHVAPYDIEIWMTHVEAAIQCVPGEVVIERHVIAVEATSRDVRPDEPGAACDEYACSVETGFRCHSRRPTLKWTGRSRSRSS